MHIAIIGIGAMGCLFASRLARVADVKMIGTWRAGIDAIRDNGVRVESASGSQAIRVFVTDDPSESSECDLALVLRKAWQTELAAQQAAQVLSPDGIALTLQNGLGNLEKLAAAVGTRRAGLGVTMQGAALVAPGHIRHAGGGATFLGKSHPAMGDVAALFQAAGFETHLESDVEALLWGKLAVNCAINPLTALLRIPNGELLSRPDAQDLMERAARECAQVAEGRGITLPYGDAAAQARQVAQATATNRSSMWQDLARGAPTEIEAINGAVAREGARLDIPTPINEFLWRLVRAMVNASAFAESRASLPVAA